MATATTDRDSLSAYGEARATIECRAYPYVHGVDIPEVVQWRWQGKA
jgi:hypothetical protein